MYIHHLRKSTMGNGGSMSHKCSYGGSIVAKPHRRFLGNGITEAVYDTDLGVVKPTKILQNIRIKKSAIPKKYITFD